MPLSGESCLSVLLNYVLIRLYVVGRLFAGRSLRTMNGSDTCDFPDLHIANHLLGHVAFTAGFLH
jgi:hypothetical protein